ncbi:MAG: acyl carrier protein [Deltaproteobacteria bacterium]|nr:acyl carrier protein [Deltaproteobacteria bacterium]
MNDQEILGLLKEALAEVAPARAADFDSITLEATIEDLDLDSVSTMEMVGFLEERVDVIFPDEELARVSRLGDLAALIRGERVSA